MNPRCFLPVLVACLACSVSRAAETIDLVNSVFEAPTNMFVTYPPLPGDRFQNIAPGVSGWASGGSLQLAYVGACGMDGGGGIHVEILQTAKFCQISFPKLDMSVFRDDHKLRDVVRSVAASLDANVPIGKSFTVYLQADTPKDLGLTESLWSTRLVLGKVVGQGQYTNYTFAGHKLSEEVVMSFVNYMRSLYLNGLTKPTGTLIFHLDPENWQTGGEFRFDNVRLNVERR